MGNFLTKQDLQAKVKEKEKKTNQTFNEVLKEIYDKIQRKNNMNTYHTLYKVPQLLVGKPLYNFENLMRFLIKKLQKGGFLVYFKNDTLLIFWNIEEKKEKTVKFKNNNDVRYYTQNEPENEPEQYFGKLSKKELEKKMKELQRFRTNNNYFNHT